MRPAFRRRRDPFLARKRVAPLLSAIASSDLRYSQALEVLVTVLGRFQRLTAFQTTSLVAWGDQPAERAHPLRHVTPVLWLCRCGHFGEPIPKPSAQTVAKAMKVGCHCSTLYSFPSKWGLSCTSLPSRSATRLQRQSLMIKDDRPAPMILCRIAHIARQLPAREGGKSLPSAGGHHPDVSNSDQLLRGVRAIIVGETSAFRSSESKSVI